MRTMLFILGHLSLVNVAIAQDRLPSFSKIDKADLELQDCDFDPGAEALVLIDEGYMFFSYVQNVGWVSESSYRVRIKVLKEKGVSRAEVKLRYRSKNKLETITNVKGISFNLDPDGKIVDKDLEKRLIYERVIDKESTEISFAIPDVRVGTVFEYQYKLTRKSYSHIPTWTFQRSIPVRYSAFNILVPEYFEYTTQTTVRQKTDYQFKNSGEKGIWYILRNIPGLKDEPYSSGRDEYLQRVEFKLSTINAPGYYENVRTTWPKIIDELLQAEVFGGELKKNIRGTKELDARLNANQSSKEKIRIIYNYVQQQMQWNQDYGIASYDGIKNAWDKKSGSITDINFILINLLKDAGIKAKPLLISTKDNGPVNTFYPFLNQFNGVMAIVEDGDDVFIMNAADKFNPYNLIPYDVANSNALIVSKGETSTVKLEADGRFSNNIFFTCSVNADGGITGQSTLNSSGYARNIRLAEISRKRMNDLFEDNSAGVTIKVDTAAVDNDEDEEKPLKQKVDFSGRLQSGGEYWFLPYNLFMGLGKNQFIAENRVMDIDFYYPRNYIVTGTYYVADDFEASELPKNTKMIMPDTSIVLSRITQSDGNIISFRVSLDIRVTGYGATGYPYVKDFFKKMYALLDERIVLKKKNKS